MCTYTALSIAARSLPALVCRMLPSTNYHISYYISAGNVIQRCFTSNHTIRFDPKTSMYIHVCEISEMIASVPHLLILSSLGQSPLAMYDSVSAYNACLVREVGEGAVMNEHCKWDNAISWVSCGVVPTQRPPRSA